MYVTVINPDSAFVDKTLQVVDQDSDNVYVKFGGLELAFAQSEVAFEYQCDVTLSGGGLEPERCGDTAILVVRDHDIGLCAIHAEFTGADAWEV